MSKTLRLMLEFYPKLFQVVVNGAMTLAFGRGMESLEEKPFVLWFILNFSFNIPDIDHHNRL